MCKHNYGFLQLVLKFLIEKQLLICFSKGVISGKNYPNLYVKVVPDQSNNAKFEDFVSQQLNVVKLNWQQYFSSCLKITLCSTSCKFSTGVERHFNTLKFIQ